MNPRIKGDIIKDISLQKSDIGHYGMNTNY